MARFLKALTYQRVSKEATPAVAPYVETIAGFEGMAAHEATATLRLRRFNC